MSSLTEQRIRNPEIRKRVTDAATAAAHIRDGMTVAMSGFTPSGYPKAVPVALAKRVRASGEKCRIFLMTGASVGEEVDTELTVSGILGKRIPYQTNDHLRRGINARDVAFLDPHLGEMDGQVRRGFFGSVHVAVVEACTITEEGHIVPTTSVGNSPTFLQVAEKVIVEVNTAQPMQLEGLHDIFCPGDPPNRKPIPLVRPGERVGEPFMRVDPDKIVAVVMTDQKDAPRGLGEPDEACIAISRYLVDFLQHEVNQGNLPNTLLPLQSGVGEVANSVLKGLVDCSFSELTVYSEVIQDGVLDLIDAGKISFASGTALTLSPARLEHFLSNLDLYTKQVILRPQEITNSGEVISRLGCIAMNTAVETDIFGNVNSSHVLGNRLINGIGGSGDFARNGYVSIFCTPSIKAAGAISSVVPMVSHVDHTDHDVDIIITEQGLADLRGMAPEQRAVSIIERCAHPSFRDALKEYWERSKLGGGHFPVDLETAFSWHVNFKRTKSMK